MAVIPRGWAFDYADVDGHNLMKLKLALLDIQYNMLDKWLWWIASVALADDDNEAFRWELKHTILEWWGIMEYGSRSRHSTSGTAITAQEEEVWQDLIGYDQATVVLVGWNMNYWNGDDHKIDRLAVRIRDVGFDTRTGKVTWRFECKLMDRNGGDPYSCRYDYMIMGFKGGLQNQTISASYPPGGVVTDQQAAAEAAYRVIPLTFQATELAGYDWGVILPQGWVWRDYGGGDLSATELGWELTPSTYDPHTGTVRAELRHKFPQCCTFRFDAVAITFNQGGVEHAPDLPRSGRVGGWAVRQLSRQLPWTHPYGPDR